MSAAYIGVHRGTSDQEEWEPFFGGRGWHPGARQARAHALRARRSENMFRVQLRRLARHIGDIVRGMFEADPSEWFRIGNAIEDYARVIEPWARTVSERMLADVSRRDAKGWHELGQLINRALGVEIATTPIGPTWHSLLVDEVEAILGIPLQAAERIYRNGEEGRAAVIRMASEEAAERVVAGQRYEELARQIMATGEVSLSHANMVARTETGRATTTLLGVRAQALGSEGYIWRTTRDRDVRERHRELEGTYHRWNEPPVATDRGQHEVRAHPGSIWNCFPGEVLVDPLGRYRRAFRARYRGPLVILRIAETFVPVTPHHPILTPEGWVAAGDLAEGDYVLQALPQGQQAVEQEINHRLLSFSQIFEAGRPHVEPLAIYDFYGDSVEEQVEIIRPTLHLPFAAEAAVFERLDENVITGADSRIAALSIGRSLAQVDKPLRAGGGDADAVLHRSFGSSDRAIDLGGAAHRDAGAHQHAVQTVTAHAKLPRQGVFTGAGEIEGLDLRPLRIRETHLDRFVGHVYTLETAHGFYAATPARIIAKNCRCWAEPVLAGEMPQLGPLPRNPAYLQALREAGYTTGTAFE